MTERKERWVSIAEAASLSGYRADSLRALIREGKIKARKFTFVWQVERRSLLAYALRMKQRGERRGPKPKLRPHP